MPPKKRKSQALGSPVAVKKTRKLNRSDKSLHNENNNAGEHDTVPANPDSQHQQNSKSETQNTEQIVSAVICELVKQGLISKPTEAANNDTIFQYPGNNFNSTVVTVGTDDAEKPGPSNTETNIAPSDSSHLDKCVHSALGLDNTIPDGMLGSPSINPRGLPIIPVSNWTMEKEGAKKVEITGLGDKRQITAVFAGSLSGNCLPPQIIYKGTTDKCHPTIQQSLIEGWDITHSPNHWANSDTCYRYIEKITITYIEKMRDEDDLPLRQKAIVMFDMFRAQLSEDFMTYLKSKSIISILVPPNCTNRLQPMDLSIQNPVKDFMKNCFQQWYTDQILNKCLEKESVEPVPLLISVVKPLHFKWLVKCYGHFQEKTELVPNGFKEAGIASVLEKT